VLCAAPFAATPAANAAPKKCFGKKIDKVVSGKNAKVKLKFNDVAYVSGKGATVIGKPYSRICGGPGRQILQAGKGKSMTDGGSGDDKILLHVKS